MVRAGIQVRAVVRVVRPLDRTNYSVQRAIPNPSLALNNDPIDAIYSLVCLVSSPRPAPNSGRCLYTIAAQIAIISYQLYIAM